MEYTSPVWHLNLTKGQTKTLEDVQRRAVQIINGNIPYDEACRLLNILPLADRHLELCRTLLQQIMRDDTHVLHCLLPPKRDTQLTGRLRSSRTYPTVYARTSHFKNSFILHALNRFQWFHSITSLHNCFICLRMIVWMYVLCMCNPANWLPKSNKLMLCQHFGLCRFSVSRNSCVKFWSKTWTVYLLVQLMHLYQLLLMVLWITFRWISLTENIWFCNCSVFLAWSYTCQQ